MNASDPRHSNVPACGVRRQELLQHHFGELGQEAEARIRGHLDSCSFCRARVEQITSEERAFQAVAEAGTVSAKILERLDAAEAEPPRSFLSALLANVRPLAAAAVLLLVAVPAAILVSDRDHPRTRSKGGGVQLEMFVKDPVEGARPAADGAVLKEGDQIQFRYRADGKRYVFVVSLTDAGVLSPLYPDAPGASIEIAPSGTHVLEGSVILDDSRGPERIFALFSDRPLTFEEVKAAVAAKLGQERHVTRLQVLEVGREDVDEASVLIQKE